MGTFLFDSIIFGPVSSRRLGISLGINCLPTDSKICNFNCIYCECGWTSCRTDVSKLPTAELIRKKLEEKLTHLIDMGTRVDTITFAGNGEPTLHPEFAKIIDNTIEIRDQYFPRANVAVLSNATLIYKKNIFDALSRVDQNILKIDSAKQETIEIINNPPKDFDINELVRNLKKFRGKLIIQTLFLRGKYRNRKIDNTTDEEVKKWLSVIREINPELVMIYTIRRDTPISTLEALNYSGLKKIADKVNELGIRVQISG